MKKTIAIIIASIFAATTESLFAQQSNFWFPDSNPPALSPWLELQRNRSSSLDNYNQYVKPRLEIERMLSTQQMSLNRQQNNQKLMQNELVRRRRGNTAGVGSATEIQYLGEAAQTGKNATFRNYLHFYPNKDTLR
ncbi:MAG: hypothetical protein LBT05_04460 [Planctomycetaceae bacterium]|jgi:hypothetical protein|nr:hypothetical protein [Planctomycetaceae bacterium]